MRNTNESALVKQAHAGTERVTLKLMFFDEDSVEKKFHFSSFDQWSDSRVSRRAPSLLNDLLSSHYLAVMYDNLIGPMFVDLICF